MSRSTSLFAVMLVATSAALFAADPPKSPPEPERSDDTKALTAEKERLAALIGKLSEPQAQLYDLRKAEAEKKREAAVAESNAVQKEAEFKAAQTKWLAESKAAQTSTPEPATLRDLRLESQKLRGESDMAQYARKTASMEVERHQTRTGVKELPAEVEKDLAARAVPPLPNKVDPNLKGPAASQLTDKTKDGGQLFDGSRPGTKGDAVDPKSGTPFFDIKPNPGSVGVPAAKPPSAPNPFNPQGPSSPPAVSAPPSSGGTSELKSAVAAKDKKAEEQKYYDRLMRDGEWNLLEAEQGEIKDKLRANKAERDAVDSLAVDLGKRAKAHNDRAAAHEARRSSVTAPAAVDEFNRVVDDINRNKEQLEKEQVKLIDRAKRAFDDLLAIEKKDRDLRARKSYHKKKWSHLDEK